MHHTHVVTVNNHCFVAPLLAPDFCAMNLINDLIYIIYILLIATKVSCSWPCTQALSGRGEMPGIHCCHICLIMACSYPWHLMGVVK